MLNAIAKPFGMLLLWLYQFVDNYGIAIFLFALVVKIILLPFQMKSKKSMMRMSSLQPQLNELQKRHEGNPRKLQEETSKLYKEEGISPMSGCLWSLIPFPILIALYQAIRYPLTVMMRVPKDLVAEGGIIANKLAALGFNGTANSAYVELQQSQFISNHFADFAGMSEKLVSINYKFLGLNLGDQPKLLFWNADGFSWSNGAWMPILGLFLIPIISGGLSFLQMKLSQNTSSQPAANTQQAQQMKSMTMMMPLVSVWICFSMPAALGIYWIFTSLLAIIQEFILNKVYGKQMEAEIAAREERMRLRAAEYERRRQETEKLRAEGKTQENSNTSKKKQQARQKAELDELKAAAIREEKAERRARLGIKDEEEVNPSQVGNRPYARGRAYDPNRFKKNGVKAPKAAPVAEEAPVEETIETPVETTETVVAPVENVVEETAAPAAEETETPAEE